MKVMKWQVAAQLRRMQCQVSMLHFNMLQCPHACSQHLVVWLHEHMYKVMYMHCPAASPLAAAQAAATSSSGGAFATDHRLPQMPNMTITDMPTDVLSCIIRHIQEDSWQRERSLDDVAALRSTCQWLRRATDLLVTHVNFHASTDAASMLSTVRRCTGESRVKN